MLVVVLLFLTIGHQPACSFVYHTHHNYQPGVDTNPDPRGYYPPNPEPEPRRRCLPKQSGTIYPSGTSWGTGPNADGRPWSYGWSRSWGQRNDNDCEEMEPQPEPIPPPMPEPIPEPVQPRFDLGQISRDQIEELWPQLSAASRNFLAPTPKNGDIPPHCLKRIVRFCSANPGAPRCQNNPEWISNDIVPSPPSVGPVCVDTEEEVFGVYTYTAPPPPKLPKENVLAGVPDDLKPDVPAFVTPLNQEEINAVSQSCTYGSSCARQAKSALFDRADIAEHHATVIRFLTGEDGATVDRSVETQFQRIHQLKQLLIRKLGLEGKVEPQNDGIFQNDVLWTTDQANYLINAIENDDPRFVPYSSPSTMPYQHPYQHQPRGYGYNGRFKRSGLFFEEQFIRQWSSTYIPYFIDPSMDASQESVIEGAIREITGSTCLNFVRQSQKPTGNFIFYSIYRSPAFCGISNIGMQTGGNNVVYMSFMCPNQNPHGIAVHETLHALGVAHEHARFDRDDHVRINWANIEPSNYAFFALSDTKLFTSYGVPYDFGSVMHYGEDVARRATASGHTISALDDAFVNGGRMGQRNGLSSNDVALLNKMYCKPLYCKDRNVYCGIWANRGRCQTSQWAQQNCQKSCDLC